MPDLRDGRQLYHLQIVECEHQSENLIAGSEILDNRRAGPEAGSNRVRRGHGGVVKANRRPVARGHFANQFGEGVFPTTELRLQTLESRRRAVVAIELLVLDAVVEPIELFAQRPDLARDVALADPSRWHRPDALEEQIAQAPRLRLFDVAEDLIGPRSLLPARQAERDEPLVHGHLRGHE